MTDNNKEGKEKKTADAAQEKAAEYKDLLQHLQAEFANYKKRVERDQQKQKADAARSLVEELLPLLDNFELAIEKADKNDENTKPFELIFSQLFDILEKQGLKLIDTDMFDPNLHEALLQEPSDKPTGTILEVMQKGYTLNGHVLRSAKVKVSRQNKEGQNKKNSDDKKKEKNNSEQEQKDTEQKQRG